MTYKEIRLSGLPCLNKWFAIKNPTGNIVSSVGLNGHLSNSFAYMGYNFIFDEITLLYTTKTNTFFLFR